MQALGTLGRRLLAWAVIAIAVVLVLKLAVGMVVGLVQTVLLFAALAVVAVGVLWALRHA